MIKTVDLNRDLEEMARVEGRGPQTTAEQAPAAFLRLYDYRDGAIFVSNFSGSSAWEAHPKGDELVQILEGTTRLEIITHDDEKHTLELAEGMLTVVPKGCWHRFESSEGVKVLTATPLPTKHTHVDDPRNRSD